MKLSTINKIYSYPPELFSRCIKSIEMSSKGEDATKLRKGALIGTLGFLCFRQLHTLVTKWVMSSCIRGQKTSHGIAEPHILDPGVPFLGGAHGK